VILDTSYLIDLFDEQPAAFEKGTELVENNIVQRVPSPVVMELSYGVAVSEKGEWRAVHNALRMYPIIPLDEMIAQRAGKLLADADVVAGGESGIDKVDPMVAAVSAHIDEPVLTANVDDFEALGVEVASY
jgi:predicted nucleic acid-binding protein